MLRWALNWVTKRQFLHCRKMLNTNPVSQLCILTDLHEVISDWDYYKGTNSFCRMVILFICYTSGTAACPERNSFISQYHIIFNIPLQVPNQPSSCKKLTLLTDLLYVSAFLEFPMFTYGQKDPIDCRRGGWTQSFILYVRYILTQDRRIAGAGRHRWRSSCPTPP